jgi:lipoprotein-anchoring transpeptidase ErfK/SrfK
MTRLRWSPARVLLLLAAVTAALPLSGARAEVSREPLPDSVARGLAHIEAHAGTLTAPAIVVDPATQVLYLADRSGVLGSWPVSTGRGGISSRPGSGGTPAGTHQIGAVLVGRHGEVFVARRPTGRIRAATARASGRAYITTAVLTLIGQERSNRTSQRRGIYIHGTNLEGSLGTPRSGGCIRMSNVAVLDLAGSVTPGTWVHVLAVDR